MKPMRMIALAAAGTALFATALPSFALTLSSGTSSGNFSWSFNTPTNPVRVLDGTGSVSSSGWGTSQLTLVFTLNNGADVLGQGGDRLTSFGFGIDPNVSGVSFTDANDGGMIGAALGSIPSLAAIEVCAYGGNNCPGGSNGGIFAQTSDTFTLTLTAISGVWTTANLDPIGFKYQTGTGSYEFTTTTTTTTTTTSGDAPEPGSTLTMLGLGLLGLGFSRRFRKAT